MRFLKRAVRSILRPIYRLLIERPLWWFLGRVKAFFLAEIGVQITATEHRVAAMEERLRAMDANNMAQWSALEQLLLALFRQPEVRIDSNDKNCEASDRLTSNAAGAQKSSGLSG